jgi:hypothetical protein
MDVATTAAYSRYIPRQDLLMGSEKDRRTTPASSSIRLPQYSERQRNPDQQSGHHGRIGPDRRTSVVPLHGLCDQRFSNEIADGFDELQTLAFAASCNSDRGVEGVLL